MKKLFASLMLSFILLAVPGMLAAKMPQKPLFDGCSKVSYEGACKSAVVQCQFQSESSIKRITLVKKNKARCKNVAVTFTNNSCIEISGDIVFNDGLWLSFSGPVMARSASRFIGQVPVSGAARLSGDVTFDMDTKTFTGNGEIVTFEGCMELKGLIKRNNDKAMMKVWVFPSSAILNKICNCSTVQKEPSLLRVKLPAIQLKKKCEECCQ